MNYRGTRFCENWNVFQPECIGKYDIPIIKPCDTYPPKWVRYNDIRKEKDKTKGVHFFLDDYKFERLWRSPEAMSEELLNFSYVLSPDFSMYIDTPKAMQLYSHYRKHWLAAYWQWLGLKVIPTIGWSDESSYSWCFDGEPKNSVVAVSSVGAIRQKESKRLFLSGWEAMLDTLKPTTVIFYGSVPKECKSNVVKIKGYWDDFKAGGTDGE